MFSNFPKQRIKLPSEISSIYEKQYISNRNGATKASSLAQKMESWLHKKVASDVQNKHEKKTLEIGAGTLNQLQYEHSTHYDIVEPFKELYLESSNLEKVNRFYSDIDELDGSEKYDRITSVATFEHITDLPKVVAKSCLLLEDEGTLRTSIPNEGTFLWTLGWKMTTGVEFKLKYGLDYGILMRHEHVNTADEIEEVLKYFYNKNECYTFGLNKRVALYRFYVSSDPKIDLALKYLETIK